MFAQSQKEVGKHFLFTFFIFWIDVTLLDRNPKRMGLFGKEKGKDPKEMVNVWIK